MISSSSRSSHDTSLTPHSLLLHPLTQVDENSGRIVLVGDILTHSGSFLLDRLAVAFVATNPGSTVFWVGCTGRSQRDVEEEIGKRGGAGNLSFIDG